MLLCTSNGVGLGHVARMMAVGQELRPDFEPVLFTLSAAIPIPVEAGFTVEHLASANEKAVSGTAWNALLGERLEQLIDAYAPRAILFDGVHPYAGLRDALERSRRRIPSIWIRRAMWKRSVAVQASDLTRLAASFAHVVEPGEYAASYDVGPTGHSGRSVDRVTPIVYSAPEPPLDRADACADLGLPVDDVNVLIQLGAGQINDIHSTVGSAVAALAGYSSVTPVVARSVLSAPMRAEPGSAAEVRRFPVTKWMAAFDAAIIAGGYNSFHEAMSMRVPTIVVPNLQTKTDDQDARSRWARDHALAFRWDGVAIDELDTAIAGILDRDTRSDMRSRLATLGPADGARQVADLVRAWVG